MKRLTLTIDSNLGDVSLVGIAINKICIYLGLDEDQAGKMELCIVEAVTNAIRHAYHGKPGQSVAIEITANAEHVDFDVSDSGTPMSEEQVKSLIHGGAANDESLSNLATLPEGGRGLQIIRDTVDRVQYIRKGPRNHLRLSKNLN